MIQGSDQTTSKQLVCLKQGCQLKRVGQESDMKEHKNQEHNLMELDILMNKISNSQSLKIAMDKLSKINEMEQHFKKTIESIAEMIQEYSDKLQQQIERLKRLKQSCPQRIKKIKQETIFQNNEQQSAFECAQQILNKQDFSQNLIGLDELSKILEKENQLNQQEIQQENQQEIQQESPPLQQSPEKEQGQQNQNQIQQPDIFQSIMYKEQKLLKKLENQEKIYGIDFKQLINQLIYHFQIIVTLSQMHITQLII